MSRAGAYIAAACRRSPEALLTVQLATALADAQSYGVLDRNVVWWHTPNEMRASNAVGALRKAMGVRRGAPDFTFVLGDRAVLVELKSEKGKLSPDQKTVREQLHAAGGTLHVCKTVGEVFRVLHQAKFAKENPYAGR